MIWKDFYCCYLPQSCYVHRPLSKSNIFCLDLIFLCVCPQMIEIRFLDSRWQWFAFINILVLSELFISPLLSWEIWQPFSSITTDKALVKEICVLVNPGEVAHEFSQDFTKSATFFNCVVVQAIIFNNLML